ncbi:hypothetical protein [Burkholderia plantarii]|nr:hypothetical protein [Burkholderia plantarii]
MSTASTGGRPLAHTSSILNESSPAQSPEEGVQPLALDELTIHMRPYDMSCCDYVGTRAQLEAEGLIPMGTVWPDGFRAGPRWEANGLQFKLNRRRPEGVKGPRREFIDCDNWCLRIEVLGSNAFTDAVARKTRELHELLNCSKPESAEVRKARHVRCELYGAAVRDEQFQAFKRLVPCLVPPPRKRRRPAAAANRSQEA